MLDVTLFQVNNYVYVFQIEYFTLVITVFILLCFAYELYVMYE